MNIKFIFPSSTEEWNDYYKLRHEVLRKPLGFAKGTEIDSTDPDSINVMLIEEDENGKMLQPLAVGRSHYIEEKKIQIRYMAVSPNFQGRGYGAMVIHFLENHAINNNAIDCILNAREPAIGFYQKLGYEKVLEGENISVGIQHCWMKKKLVEL